MNALATSILAIAISHGGHCCGNGPCSVDVTWAADAAVAPAVLTWTLSYADTVVAEGRVSLGSGAPAHIPLDLPQVRARTECTWTYRLLRENDGQVLEEGRRAILLYPSPVPENLSARLGPARVLVLEKSPALSHLLERAGVAHQVISGYADLELRPADLVLVGPDRLSGTALDGDGALLAAARRGAGVLVLVQREAPKVAGLEVVRHPAASNSAWRTDHPLLAGLPDDLWQSWLAASTADVPALVVPPAEPALEIAYWPPRADGRRPGPLDVTVLEEKLERGRLVLCQVPASADLDDPRTQTFLVNALQYLRTSPQPTPARAERWAASQPAKPAGSRPVNTLGVHDE
jgi:hypothetical protein